MLPLPENALLQQGSCGQTGRQILWKLHFQMHSSLSSRNLIQFQVSERSWKPSWHLHWLWWFLAGRMLCVFCHLRNWLSFLLFCDSIAKINFCFALIEVVCASKLFAEHVHTSFCRPLIWFITKKILIEKLFPDSLDGNEVICSQGQSSSFSIFLPSFPSPPHHPPQKPHQMSEMELTDTFAGICPLPSRHEGKANIWDTLMPAKSSYSSWKKQPIWGTSYLKKCVAGALNKATLCIWGYIAVVSVQCSNLVSLWGKEK